MIIRQFPNQKRTRMIAGAMAGTFTKLEYSTSELRGEFAFDMDYSAMMADNPAVRETRAMVRYNMFRADPLVDPEGLILDVYRAQNVANPEKALMFLRSPAEEAQMMLQGLPVEAHDRDPHEDHIGQHSQQSEMMADQLSRIPREPGGEEAPVAMKIRLAMALNEAHIQDHVLKVQRLSGASPRPPGQPVAENMLRNQVKVAKGGETAAEMTGQPLTSEGMVQ
jgi:hypothetical protein